MSSTNITIISGERPCALNKGPLVLTLYSDDDITLLRLFCVFLLSAMAKTVPSVTIKNGTGSIPVVGLGTWTVLGQQVSLTGLHKFIYHKMLKSA